MKPLRTLARTGFGIFSLLVLFVCQELFGQDGAWTEKSPIPMEKPSEGFESVGFSINGKGYVTFGMGVRELWEYDPIMDVWSQKANFAGYARDQAVGFAIGNKGYVGTGFNGDLVEYLFKDFWEYDPSLNKWTKKADVGGEPRYQATAFSIGDKGYLFGGNNGSDFWEYNPELDRWTKKADIPGGPRFSAVAVGINNRGYVATGESSSQMTNDFWEYDPFKDLWTRRKDFPGKARSNAVAFSISGKAYLGTGMGGFPSFEHLNDFWEYDPENDVWLRKPDVGGLPRTYAIAFAIGFKGFIGTGQAARGFSEKDFWEYNSLSNVWTEKAGFGHKTTGHYVAVGLGMKGYFLEQNAVDDEKRFLEFDVLKNSWKTLPEFPGHFRAGASGFALFDKVYIAGGRVYNFDPLSPNEYIDEFWEFDLKVATWSRKADLPFFFQQCAGIYNT